MKKIFLISISLTLCVPTLFAKDETDRTTPTQDQQDVQRFANQINIPGIPASLQPRTGVLRSQHNPDSLHQAYQERMIEIPAQPQENSQRARTPQPTRALSVYSSRDFNNTIHRPYNNRQRSFILTSFIDENRYHQQIRTTVTERQLQILLRNAIRLVQRDQAHEAEQSIHNSEHNSD